MSAMCSRIKMFPFIKEYVSVHHLIIWTCLKNITSMLLSSKMVVHFFFNAWMEFMEQEEHNDNEIGSLVQWLQF